VIDLLGHRLLPGDPAPPMSASASYGHGPDCGADAMGQLGSSRPFRARRQSV
jgi:hypothetical protein